MTTPKHRPVKQLGPQLMSPMQVFFPSFFQFGADVWVSRVWPPLPQLTLWPESHIISTHFPNHDMANMRRLKPQGTPLPFKHASVSARVQTRFKVWQPLSAHPLPLSIRSCVSEHEKALTTHEIPTSVPRTLGLWRNTAQAIIEPYCGGSSFLFPHSPICLDLFLQANGFLYIFLRDSTG